MSCQHAFMPPLSMLAGIQATSQNADWMPAKNMLA